jgi:protein O-mannosyl-transferase
MDRRAQRCPQCLFFALTLLAWSTYTRRKSAARYLIALLAAALGTLSKPMLVTIPFVLLLIDYWPLNRFQNEKIIPLVLEKIPFALFAAASAVGTVLAQHGQIDTFGFSLPLRFENAIVSYAIYLRQLIWPVDSAVLYPHPEKFFPIRIIAGCSALLIALSAIAIAYRKRFPFLFTGWFWFVGMLVPVIGIVQVGRQAHADRYTYLPLVGITIGIVWLVAELTARWRFRKQIGVLVSAVVIIALSACAYHQTAFWRNADSLWPHTLAVTTDNDGAHLAFATALFAEGKTEEAIAHARARRRKFARPMRVLMGKYRLVWKGNYSTKRFFSGARESKTSRAISAPATHLVFCSCRNIRRAPPSSSGKPRLH